MSAFSVALGLTPSQAEIDFVTPVTPVTPVTSVTTVTTHRHINTACMLIRIDFLGIGMGFRFLLGEDKNAFFERMVFMVSSK